MTGCVFAAIRGAAPIKPRVGLWNITHDPARWHGQPELLIDSSGQPQASPLSATRGDTSRSPGLEPRAVEWKAGVLPTTPPSNLW